MSTSRITTVWCNGIDGEGAEHADDCPQWSGEGHDAREARAASLFTHRGLGQDYWPACLRIRMDRKAEVRDV